MRKGSQWGISFAYAEQPRPEGLTQTFIIGRDFVEEEKARLILGDDIFFDHGLPDQLKNAVSRKEGATVFGYWVRDPGRYGVVTFDINGKAVDIEEKPIVPNQIGL